MLHNEILIANDPRLLKLLEETEPETLDMKS